MQRGMAESLRRQASVNVVVVLNALCSRTADTSNISLNKKYVLWNVYMERVVSIPSHIP